MKVEIIQMTFLPGRPEWQVEHWVGEDVASEPLVCSGVLLKNGVVVAVLPRVLVTPMQNYIDGVFVAPTHYTTMWEMEPVDADTLELHASAIPGSAGYTHAIYVNGKEVGLIFDAGWAIPEDYVYGLRELEPIKTLVIAATVGAVGVVGALGVAILASRAKGD